MVSLAKNKNSKIFFGILLFLILPIYIIVRIHPWVIESQDLVQSKTKSIETNGFTFSKDSFLLASKYTKLVISTTKSDSSERDLFVADQESNYVSHLRQVNSDNGSTLKKLSSYNLSDTALSPGEKDSYFIFDLLLDKSSLLVSYVRIPHNMKKCNDFELLSIPYNGQNLRLDDAKLVWRAPICIKTYPNDPGWSAFHGRLAVSSENIYISIGMLITETYLGTFPNRNIKNLGEDLFEELERLKIFGKIIAIDKKSLIATPFVSGLRAPSGIYVHTENPAILWITDHGPRGGDELNVGKMGDNFGWPHVSLGERYYDNVPLKPKESLIPTTFLNHSGFKAPIFYWTPSIAPSSIVALDRDFGVRKSWEKGDLLMGSLKAKSLFRIVTDDEDSIRLIEQINLGDRIRDLSLANYGIWYSTDDGQVVLLRESKSKKGQGMFPKSIVPDQSSISKFPIVSDLFTIIDKIVKKLVQIISSF